MNSDTVRQNIEEIQARRAESEAADQMRRGALAALRDPEPEPPSAVQLAEDKLRGEYFLRPETKEIDGETRAAVLREVGRALKDLAV